MLTVKLSITRLGKCVGTVAQVLRTYDEHNVGTSSSHHKTASSDKDLQQLVTELVVNTPFTAMKGRKLKRFKLKTSLMDSIKEDVMKTWMKEKWRALLVGLL